MKSLKKFAVSVLTVATIGMTAVPVFAASENATPNEGHTGMVVDRTSSPLTRSSEASGGKWSYGVGSTYVWSYYYHKHRVHKASVRPGWFAATITSGWVNKGVWAKVSARKGSGGNAAYYDVD